MCIYIYIHVQMHVKHVIINHKGLRTLGIHDYHCTHSNINACVHIHSNHCLKRIQS